MHMIPVSPSMLLTIDTYRLPRLHDAVGHLQCFDLTRRHFNPPNLTAARDKRSQSSTRNTECMKLAETTHRGAGFGQSRNASVTLLE